MPRHAKGPRLYLRRGKRDPKTGGRFADTWVIRDGAREISTGCPRDGLDGPDGAESQLAAYIGAKWAPTARSDRPSDPASVLVAEVLALYAKEKAPTLAKPKDAASRIKILTGFWGDKTLADVKRSTCKAYVAWRVEQPFKHAKFEAALLKRVAPETARRELEDLSAAITFWNGEYPLAVRPVVWLPEKRESQREALTRDQAACLLRASLGWRLDPSTGRWTRIRPSSAANRRHMRRFLLIGLYTGTRPGVIPKLLWEESATQAWTDLDAGVIYRRGRAERDHKTKRRPMVRLPDRLVAHMRRWHRQDMQANEARRVKGVEPVTTVLHHGAAPIEGRIRRGFASIVADAGLPPEVTPHWMRHTCATWLMEAEVPIWDAAAFTGMTTKTLETCYGHHRPSHQNRARRAL